MIQRINDNANALKVVLTLMVVFIHSFSLVPADENTLLYSIKIYLSSVLPRVAVSMFFIYSGRLLFMGGAVCSSIIMVCTFVNFAMCEKLYNELQRYCPELLTLLVGNRISRKYSYKLYHFWRNAYS